MRVVYNLLYFGGKINKIIFVHVGRCLIIGGTLCTYVPPTMPILLLMLRLAS